MSFLRLAARSSVFPRFALSASRVHRQSPFRAFAAASGLPTQDIETRVLDVLKGFEKVDPSKLATSSHFSKDLGLDSLDAVEVVMAVEEEFAIEIPDAEADEIQTVQQAIDYIAKTPEARIVVDTPLLEVGCTLGEGPVYDIETLTLHFVDIEERKVYHLNTLTNTLTIDEYPVPITSIALRRKKPGALAATTADGFALLNPPSGVEYLSRPLPAEILGLSRFNDGACDSRGRYFAGTVYSPKHGIPGKLYRYDPSNGSSVIVDDGPFTDSNGLGWSLDEKFFYFTDSWPNLIYVYDYNPETGGISNRKVFVDAGEFGYSGVCDGLCLDTEGGVWSARWEGSRIVRFNSSGTPDFEIVFPTVFKVTSCCFGGPNLDQLYITTAHCGSVGGDASKQIDYPHSGHIFVVDFSGKFKGIPRSPFNG